MDTINAAEIALNTFTGNHSAYGGTNSGITVNAQGDYFQGTVALIHDNVFVEDTIDGPAKALRLGADAEVRHNRFEDIPAHSRYYAQYTVLCSRGNVVLRDNIFHNTGRAVGTDEYWNPFVDAIWNYWGDSTGPYNEYSNPNGRGDTIIGNVAFDPWYRDTRFWNKAESRIPIPRSYSIQAWPNPFNGQVRILLELPEAAMANVTVYDVLGRKATELYHGPLIDRKELTWDGGSFASGVYFVHAFETIYNRPLASCKVVLVK